MQRDSLPAVCPDSTVAEHLVVLALLAIGRGSIIERVHHRDAVHRLLLDTVIYVRNLNTGCLHDRRRDIGNMVILIADFTFGLDAVGPVDDEMILLPAAVFTLLEVTEWRVAGHCPTGVIVRVSILATPVLEVAQIGFEFRLQAVEHIGFIEGTGQAALAARAVISRDEDQRIVELADAFKFGDDATDLHIDPFHLCGEYFHLPGVEFALLGG